MLCMEKRNLNNEQEVNKSTFEERKKRNSSKSNQISQKRLPWWVELLFVQIGLPDKWLIKILKTKKDAKEIYKNDKKMLLALLLFVFSIGYIQPLINYSKTKLKCQRTFKNYILKSNTIQNLKTSELKMMAVNFCNGGVEFDNLKQLK